MVTRLNILNKTLYLSFDIPYIINLERGGGNVLVQLFTYYIYFWAMLKNQAYYAQSYALKIKIMLENWLLY